MSHQDNVFNDKNFVDNYEIWAQGDDPVVNSPDTDEDWQLALDVLQDELGTDETEDFFKSYSKETNPFTSWSAFLNKAADGDNDVEDNILKGFVDAYRAILNMGEASVVDDPPGEDWQGIEDALGALTPAQSINVPDQFINSFNAFLRDYDYPDKEVTDGDGNVTYEPGGSDEFFAAWQQYMGVTARIGTTNDSIIDYQQVYKAFGFEEDDFDARVAQFILKQQDVKQGGHPYFIPSHNFDEWFEELRQDFIHQNFLSTVDTGTKSELLVIDRILRLLITIVDTLQKVSAVQANRLGFLTDWQTAYTDQLAEIPQFTVGGNVLTDSHTDDDDENKEYRSELNARMQSITEKVRAWRSAVQDEAKAMQSTINQSQDAANQQTQMATSIIQQLSTILSQIFR